MSGIETRQDAPAPRGTVTFRNQPRAASESALIARNEKERQDIIDRLEEFILTHERFVGKHVNVDYFQTGVSSLAMKIKTPDETVVLKIPFGGDSTAGEAFALRSWKKAGVVVPDVYDQGKVGKSDFILMQYIPTDSLSKATTHEERLEQGIYEYLGTMMRRMHTVKTHGNGPIDGNGVGPIATFDETLASVAEGEDGRYVVEHGLVSAAHITAARAAMVAYEKEHPTKVLCHMDYGIGNTLASNPPTVFDPAPTSTIHYMDVGRAVYGLVSEGDEAIERFLKAYEEGDGGESMPLDKKIVHAGVLFISVHKLAKSHKNQHDPALAARIPRIQGYLEKNKHLLEDVG